MKEKPGLFWENGACFRYFTLSGDLLLMCFSATNFFSSKSLWDVLKIFPSFLSIFTLLVFLSLLLTPLFPNITACPSVNLAYLSNSFIFLNIKKRLFFFYNEGLFPPFLPMLVTSDFFPWDFIFYLNWDLCVFHFNLILSFHLTQMWNCFLLSGPRYKNNFTLDTCQIDTKRCVVSVCIHCIQSVWLFSVFVEPT